jgi:Mrp family chromosome partitioning ATPase
MKINSQLTLDRFLNLVGFGKKINFEWEHTKLILQGFVASSSFTTIQNNLESTRNKPEEPLTTLMVTPMPNSSLTMVAFAYARQSSTQGRKTILIDFDLKDVPFTKYLETYNIETKKKASSKEGVTFLSLEENLDLYLPLQDIIPAKVIRDQETEDIITQIKKKYDHIIILGPSLLPDSSNISILSYVNSALIIANASKSTTIDLIESVNLLIDKHLTAIETLVVEEKVLTKFPSLSVIQSWFTFKPKQKPTPPSLQKPTKKK